MDQQAENQGKQAWPELVGKTYDEAREAILADDSTLNVVKVLENSPVTMDLRMDRVRVIVNAEDKVVMPPNRG